MAAPSSNAQKATTLHSQITGGTYAAPPTPAHTAVLNALRLAGVLTPSGAYVAGKGQADVEKALAVPEIRQDILFRAGNVIGL